jgi:NADH-quinone oxidoreductase subunit L
LFLGVLGAAVTALYTTRLVWLAFFGEPRVQRHAHDAGPAMRVSLGLLALGTLTTWLLAGLLERMLTPCLESACTLGAMVSQVSTAPSTLITLVGISAGIAGWWWWQGRAFTRSPVLARMAASGFGFEWINKRIVASTRDAASALRALQTGQLNWNVAGIVGGLILVLAILMWSA